LVASAILVGCYTGPSATHYVAVLDELQVPAGWQSLATKVHGPDADAAIHCSPITDAECPSALRYFAVTGDADDIRSAGIKTAAAAGFQPDRQLGQECRPISGGPYCAVEMARRSEHLLLAIYGSADEAGIPGTPAKGLVVVLTAKA
jgi:hypothetical protein